MNCERVLSDVADHDFPNHGSAPSPSISMEATISTVNAPGAQASSTLPDDNITAAPADSSAPSADSSAPAPPNATSTLTATATTDHDTEIQSMMATAMPGLPTMPVPMPMPMPSLDAPISLPEDLNMGMVPDFSMMNGALDMDMGNFAPPAPVEQRLSAFARIRFDDGSYYMHTYQIVLGRNVDLAHKDMRRFAKADQLKANGESQRAEALLNGKRRKKDRVGARSVISEAGGIVNAPIQMMPMAYQQRRQSFVSQALSTGANPPGDEKEPQHAPQEMIMQAFPEAPDTFDSHVPENPNDCPLVPIHPQNITDRTGLHGPKGISRQHAKIYYDFDHGNFCLAVLGSNGLFHEGNFLQKGTCVELNHGDTITVGMVEMTFFLPDIALTEEQLNRGHGSESQSRPMSFSFENGQGESEDMDASSSEEEKLSINPRHVYHQPNLMWDEDSEDMKDVNDMDEEDQYSPVPRPKPSLKIKFKTKTKSRVPPPKPSKSVHKHKRKHVREPSSEEPLVKKAKMMKSKETHKEPPKEKERDKEKSKAAKVPAKVPTKAPAKTPTKLPAQPFKQETPKAASPSTESTAAEPKPAPTSTSTPGTPVISTASPDAVRKPEITLMDPAEGGEGGDLITPDMAKRYNLPEVLIGQYIEKRKGPGRPPKDGMMSKRQKSQLVKRGKEIERAQAAGIDPADLPQPIAKPKFARRKESNAGEDEDIRETTEKAELTGTPGDRKQPKPSKPARTPSPELRISDFTEEQLARPTSNYVVLIHEAISSAASGQMNLQQIYNYIEKTYPWYKFKTTTSGWQSSVRHNLGQHDAFVKGDKEGKGYMWRINPNVSIEKERRKRQVSPPQVTQAQRQGYYPPPPSGYPSYSQPGYYPGTPQHGHPQNGPPRPPPPEPPQPRLPPSMARNAGSTTAAAPPSAPAPSPYASPWAGGNAAGSPPVPNPSRPYPPPNNSQTPPVTSAPYASGQYGVLYPTNAPPSPSPYGNHTTAGAYGNHYATAGPSPYGPPQHRPSPYSAPPAGPAVPAPPVHNVQAQPAPTHPPQHPLHHSNPPAPPHGSSGIPHPSGRYPLSTNNDLIRQLEAFRTVYLQTRIEAGEDQKVNNAIRAYVTPELTSTLTSQEHHLLQSIHTIPRLRELKGMSGAAGKEAVVKQENGVAAQGVPTATTASAAAIAADAAANTLRSHLTSIGEPHKFTPNMTGQASALAQAPPSASVSTTQRPSVEPLTPVPGSPAVQNGAPRLAAVETVADATPAPAHSGVAATGAQEDAKPAMPAPASAPAPQNGFV